MAGVFDGGMGVWVIVLSFCHFVILSFGVLGAPLSGRDD